MGDSAPLPSWYDDLAGFEQACWRLVVRGVKDRRSPFHTPVLANVGHDGAPEARTLVLRSADEESRTLRFHTDLRSAKFASLADDGRVAVTFYDKVQKLQLRARGIARALTAVDATEAEAAWNATRSFSRECYRVAPVPGTPIAAGAGYAHDHAEDEGRAAFAIILVEVTELEALYLAAAGHRRARFGETAEWLVP